MRGGAALLAHEFIAVRSNVDVASKMLVVDNWRAVLPRYRRYHGDTPDEILFEMFSECLAARGFGGL